MSAIKLDMEITEANNSLLEKKTSEPKINESGDILAMTEFAVFAEIVNFL